MTGYLAIMDELTWKPRKGERKEGGEKKVKVNSFTDFLRVLLHCKTSPCCSKHCHKRLYPMAKKSCTHHPITTASPTH